MDVSVIIVNYNTCVMTKKCIDSIFVNTKNIDFEVILVDNNSRDESRTIFEKDERIKYIYNHKNIGFGCANNIGVEVANGRNVIFLNSDTLLINNAIKIMSDFLDGNDNAGACGGNLYNNYEEPSHSFGRFFPSIFWEINLLSNNIIEKIIYGKSTSYNYSNKVLKVAHIIGADLMVKKKILDVIGGFNPCFFMYREETELCYRIYNSGYGLYSVPNAKIIHFEGYSVRSNAIDCKRIKWLLVSNKIFLEMYHNKLYVKIAMFIYSITAYTRVFMCKFVRKDKAEYWNIVKDVIKSI